MSPRRSSSTASPAQRRGERGGGVGGGGRRGSPGGRGGSARVPARGERPYAAIRLAAPGGLGRAPDQDVARPPTVTLRDAMALAAPRDTIAREYATDFRLTFEVGAPALRRALADGLPWSDAVVETFLTLLAAAPDTHIARKLGPDAAAAVTRRAQAVARAGGVRSAAGRAALAAFDAELRDARNTKNPGAAADLTTAAIFVALVEGGWSGGGGGDAGA